MSFSSRLSRVGKKSLAMAAVGSTTVALAVAGMSPASAADPVELPDESQRFYNASVSANSLSASFSDGETYSYAEFGYANAYSARRNYDVNDGLNVPVQDQYTAGYAAGLRGYGEYEYYNNNNYAYSYNGNGDKTVNFEAADTQTVDLAEGQGTVASVGNNDGVVPTETTTVSETTTEVGAGDLQPITSKGATFDPLTSDATFEANTSLQLTRLPGEEPRLGMFATATGESTGSFKVLNDSVTVEIEGVYGLTLNDVRDGEADYTHTNPTVTITAPDGTVTTTNESQYLEIQDPNNPNLRASISINSSFGSYYEQDEQAYAGLTPVNITYFNDDQNDETWDYAGNVSAGALNSFLQAPEAGIDASPLPDSDNDGLTDYRESKLRTDPRLTDTDEDGLNDGDEINIHKTSARDSDTDQDGLSDGDEVNVYESNPLNYDSDADGLEDGQEVELGTKLTVDDTDEDGLLDGEEVNTFDSDPLLKDTDSGGADDGEEASAGTDPRDPADDYRVQDRDMDGLTGAEEDKYGTDPNKRDTDNDGLTDGMEVNTYGSNPLAKDTDKDGLQDAREIALGTKVATADSDKDGLKDGAEVSKYKTDPLVKDTDKGGVSDGREIALGTDPLNRKDDVANDTDKDGLSDAQERKLGTNVRKADTDNDGLKDGVEVNGYFNGRFKQTFKSNPLKKDSDKDGLTDRQEVTGNANGKFNFAPTDPRKKNTDQDKGNDGVEVRWGNNPAIAGE